MRLLSGTSIRVKLGALVVLPTLVVLALTTTKVVDLQHSADRAARLSSAMRVNAVVTALVHQIQLERGLSSGFVSSTGAKFAAEVDAQRTRSDEALATFADTVETVDLDACGPELAALLSPTRDDLARLEERRAKVA